MKALLPLLLLCALPLHAQTTRIACGQSSPYTDSKGQVWQADAPPDCSDGTCSIVWTGPSGTVTLTPGQTGTLVIRKPSGDTTVVTVGP